MRTSRTPLVPAARRRLLLVGTVLTFAVAACGSSGGGAQVASLDTSDATGSATPSSSAPADTQAALLAYAACMRDHDIDMPDPTFDADGNPTGRLFGRDSGIDPRSNEFRTAQDACGNLIEGITLGAGRGRFDPEAVQASMNDFTACLRDQGLDVDDITFGGGQGPGSGNGGFGGPLPDGSAPDATGATPPDGSAPGGFEGGSDGGRRGPGGEGFDPTARIIERLGLDNSDPAVSAAITSCQSILAEAFRPTTTTTTAP